MSKIKFDFGATPAPIVSKPIESGLVNGEEKRAATKRANSIHELVKKQSDFMKKTRQMGARQTSAPVVPDLSEYMEQEEESVTSSVMPDVTADVITDVMPDFSDSDDASSFAVPNRNADYFGTKAEQDQAEDGASKKKAVFSFTETNEHYVEEIKKIDNPPKVNGYMGVPAHALKGYMDDIPVGSHYPKWQWDMLSRHFDVVVEIHSPDNPRRFMSNADMRQNNMFVDLAPTRNTRKPRHCLMGLPADNTFKPWGDAKRVLLVPRTKSLYSKAGERKNRRGDVYKVPDVYRPSPKDVSRWLRSTQGREPSHMVIYGWCQLATNNSREMAEEFWVILPEEHLKVLEARAEQNGVTENPDSYNSMRYLGEMRSSHSGLLLRNSYNNAGVVCPEDWPEQDKKDMAKISGFNPSDDENIVDEVFLHGALDGNMAPVQAPRPRIR